MEARETRQMQGGAAVRISAGGEQGVLQSSPRSVLPKKATSLFWN